MEGRLGNRSNSQFSVQMHSGRALELFQVQPCDLSVTWSAVRRTQAKQGLALRWLLSKRARMAIAILKSVGALYAGRQQLGLSAHQTHAREKASRHP